MDLHALLKMASRNTLRRKARSALTAGMVVVSVGLLLVALSFLQGVFSQMLASVTGITGHVRIASTDYAKKEELMPLDANLPEVGRLTTAVEATPGVLQVEPRITTGVTVTVGEEIGDVFALAVGGTDRYFTERLEAKDSLSAGSWFTGGPDELVAGSKVVEQLKAKLGDELVLLGATQDGSLSAIKGKLVGVVNGPGLTQQILVPLDRMRYLADLTGGATELLVYGADYRQAPRLAEALRANPALAGLSVQAWTQREPWGSLARSATAVQWVLVLIISLLTALGIWNTMMTSVLERQKEIGVLRSMGLTRPGAVVLFVGEATAIALVGGLIGAGLGALPAWYFTHFGITFGEQVSGNMNIPMAQTMHAQLNWGVALFAYALGVVMALVGSLVPALRAASVQPATAMRS